MITVLSGMSNIAQMEDNLSFMKDFNGLTESEKETLDKAREAMSKIPLIPCTTCNYCAKVCPMEIGISGSFTAMNYLTLYGNKAAAKTSGRMAGRRPWQKARRRMCKMWTVRGSLSAAYLYP